MNKITKYKVFCRSAYKVDKLKRYKKNSDRVYEICSFLAHYVIKIA